MAYEDFFGLQPSGRCDVQFFVGGSEPLQVWQKPRGATMLCLFGVGAGSGGGGGHSASTGVVRGGGGGGASGALTRVLIPMFFVPDRLYIQVGAGGAGGAATVNGGVSVKTFVSIDASSVGADMMLLVANHSGTGGVAGSTGGGAAGGVAGVLNTIAEMIQAQNGLCQFLAGKVGAAGGASTPAAGANNTLNTTHQFNGGGGGGTTGSANGTTAGGTQASAGSFTAIGAGAAGGGFGLGARPYPVFCSAGGTGGGSASGSAGGNGGGASPGSGGGGGGGGSTGGTGGSGGPGFVLAVSW